MFSNIKFIVESGLYLLPEGEQRMTERDMSIKVGDLYYVGKKLCLVIEISQHHAVYRKRVLLQWIGEEDNYWISYDLFTSMVQSV